MNLKKILPSAGALAMLLAASTAPAFAQDNAPAPQANSNEPADDEIVVTGTSIRGIAPAGSSVIGVTQEDIQASGALTVQDLMATIPQSQNSFNAVAQPGGGPGTNLSGTLPIARVQLRPLPGQNNGGGMQTLILMDGHRLGPLGAAGKLSVDPNLLAPGILDRVEIITDGGSAIYGSDAVDGVINYITRRRFDGVQVDANYGVGEGGYERSALGLTVGRDWGSGSLFASINTAKNDALFGRDRDWIRDYHTTPTGSPCLTPNISAGGQNFTPADFNTPSAGPVRCDINQAKTFAPSSERESVAIGFSQDLNEDVRFDFRLISAHSININHGVGFSTGPLNSTVTLTSTNPYFHPLPSLGNPNQNQSVAFDYSPVFGPAAKNWVTEDLWQATPELTWNLFHDWQFRGFLSHSESEVSTSTQAINGTALGQAGSSSDPNIAINPYNIAGSSQAALDRLFITNLATGRTSFSNARAILDGPLFSLPAGEVRAAVGAEYIDTAFESRTSPTSGTLPIGPAASVLGAPSKFGQHAHAYFAELQLPIVSPENNIFLIHSLSFQGSIRRDEYSDFGRATNGAWGVTYEPVSWISLYGNYSESFVAPTPIEQAAASLPVTVSVADTGTGAYQLPNGLTNTAGAVITVGGGGVAQGPQTSDSYTLGFDVRPPIVKDLSIHASFFHTLLMNRLGGSPLNSAPGQLNTNRFYDSWAGSLGTASGFSDGTIWYTASTPGAPISQTLVDSVIAKDPGAAVGALAPYTGVGAQPVALVIDTRARNSPGRDEVEGWDFGFNYSHPMSWGSLDAAVNGTIINVLRSQTTSSSPWINKQTRFQSDLTSNITLGATIDNWRVQATTHLTTGRLVAPSGTLTGGHLDSFHPTDLFVGYTFDDTAGATKDLRLSLNVTNLFDEEPEGLAIAGVGSANGFTLGRIVQFGVSKKF